jgi:putative ATP-binding cassette transporter
MALLALLRQQSGGRLVRMAALSGLAGLGNALVMAVASHTVSSGEATNRRLILFALAVVIYVIAQRGVVRGSAREIEQVVHHLRMQLLDRVRNADFAALGRLQPAEAYSAVTRDTQAISQAATALTLSSQAAILLFFTLLYLLWLSPLEFAVLGVAGALLGIFTSFRAVQDRAALDNAVGLERVFLADVTGLLDGFKEAKVSSRRRRAQLAGITTASNTIAEAKAAVGGHSAAGAVAVQTGVYLALALLVFGVPLFADIDTAAQRQTVTALLFAAGSISLLVQGIPILAAADEAAESLAALAARLPPEQAGQAPLPDGPADIDLKAVTYTWRDQAGTPLFQLGPLDLRIEPGQIVFITGGNGSGKSTLLRLVSGLLLPETGTLSCRGERITADNLQTYRDGIGGILSDLHLFRRPYGLPRDPTHVAALLEEYGLTGKIALLPDGSWDGVALSGGQRKRLAMVSLQLAAPSIVILDEWAADQDPEFRRRFYQHILPALRDRQCAVLCATHDSRYFAVADRCYILRDGRLTPTMPAPESLV